MTRRSGTPSRELCCYFYSTIILSFKCIMTTTPTRTHRIERSSKKHLLFAYVLDNVKHIGSALCHRKIFRRNKLRVCFLSDAVCPVIKYISSFDHAVPMFPHFSHRLPEPVMQALSTAVTDRVIRTPDLLCIEVGRPN